MTLACISIERCPLRRVSCKPFTQNPSLRFPNRGNASSQHGLVNCSLETEPRLATTTAAVNRSFKPVEPFAHFITHKKQENFVSGILVELTFAINPFVCELFGPLFGKAIAAKETPFRNSRLDPLVHVSLALRVERFGTRTTQKWSPSERNSFVEIRFVWSFGEGGGEKTKKKPQTSKRKFDCFLKLLWLYSTVTWGLDGLVIWLQKGELYLHESCFCEIAERIFFLLLLLYCLLHTTDSQGEVV